MSFWESVQFWLAKSLAGAGVFLVLVLLPFAVLWAVDKAERRWWRKRKTAK